MPGFRAEVEVRCGSCRRWYGGGRSELGWTLRRATCVVVDGDGLGRVKYDRRDVWTGRGVAVCWGRVRELELVSVWNGGGSMGRLVEAEPGCEEAGLENVGLV